MWAARIPLNSYDWTIDPCIENLTLLEQLCPEIPAPHLKGCPPEGINLIGQSYLLLDWIKGCPLTWTPTTPGPEQRKVLLDALAKCLLNLWTSPVLHHGVDTILEMNMGKDYQTASSWPTAKLDQGLAHNLSHQNESNIINTLIQLSLVPQYIDSRFETAPFVLSHDDLWSANIIVNDNYELHGLIDWDLAEIMPLQFAVRTPHSLANTPGYYPIVEDDPFCGDRKYFVETFGQQERTKWGTHYVTDLLKTCDDRRLFVASLLIPESTQDFWTRHCPWTEDTLREASVELDQFVQRHPQYSGRTRITRARSSIL